MEIKRRSRFHYQARLEGGHGKWSSGNGGHWERVRESEREIWDFREKERRCERRRARRVLCRSVRVFRERNWRRFIGVLRFFLCCVCWDLLGIVCIEDTIRECLASSQSLLQFIFFPMISQSANKKTRKFDNFFFSTASR